MSERVEVRATVNLPSLPVGGHVLVDPESPYVAVCLESGALVRTGRQVTVPTPQARGAVRPPTEEFSPESSAGMQENITDAGAEPAKPKRAPRRKKTAQPPAL